MSRSTPVVPRDPEASMPLDFGLVSGGAGHYVACTDTRYWNQIGPFGGWLAALATTAAAREMPADWALRSVSLQFLGRLPEGRIEIATECLRVQRRVAAVRATLRPAADTRVAVTAEAVFGAPSGGAVTHARRRPRWPAPATLPRLAALDPLAAFVRTFDYRVVVGAPFAGERVARSGGWLRSRLPLPSGPAALLLLADAWFPPRWAALSEPVPVSTVSMQVVLHETLAGHSAGDGHFAACFEEDARADGFGLERGVLWWPDGRLALTMQQLTWVGAPASGKGER